MLCCAWCACPCVTHNLLQFSRITCVSSYVEAGTGFFVSVPVSDTIYYNSVDFPVSAAVWRLAQVFLCLSLCHTQFTTIRGLSLCYTQFSTIPVGIINSSLL